MPRTTLITIFLAVGLFFICYSQVAHFRTARNLCTVLEIIEEKGLYPLGQKYLFRTAVSAMAETHDIHSAYIPPFRSDRYLRMLDQQMTGIGISVTQDANGGGLVVANPIIGQPHPAYDAGIRAGDEIVQVAGKPVADKSLAEVTKQIQGKAGTEVEIVVQRGEATQRIPLRVKRAKITVDSVLGVHRTPDTSWNFSLPSDPDIAYFQITDFGDRTAEELRKALAQVTANKPPVGIIIDLRDNAGGYLSAAIDTADLFLHLGNIVTTRGRGGTIRETFDAHEGIAWPDIPLVVLVNGQSASASEIFAACMQDHQRATIVGNRSFGKGSVQQMIPLPDGGLLKLTTSTYHRPNGENINRQPSMDPDATWGVHPDDGWEVRVTEQQEKQRREQRGMRVATPVSAPAATEHPAADPALEKAIEAL